MLLGLELCFSDWKGTIFRKKSLSDWKYMSCFVISSKLVKVFEYISVALFAKEISPTKLCCVLSYPKLLKAETQNCGLACDRD